MPVKLWIPPYVDAVCMLLKMSSEYVKGSEGDVLLKNLKHKSKHDVTH